MDAAADCRLQRWMQQQTGGNRMEAAVEVETTDWRQQRWMQQQTEGWR